MKIVHISLITVLWAGWVQAETLFISQKLPGKGYVKPTIERAERSLTVIQTTGEQSPLAAGQSLSQSAAMTQDMTMVLSQTASPLAQSVTVPQKIAGPFYDKTMTYTQIVGKLSRTFDRDDRHIEATCKAQAHARRMATALSEGTELEKRMSGKLMEFQKLTSPKQIQEWTLSQGQEVDIPGCALKVKFIGTVKGKLVFEETAFKDAKPNSNWTLRETKWIPYVSVSRFSVHENKGDTKLELSTPKQ